MYYFVWFYLYLIFRGTKYGDLIVFSLCSCSVYLDENRCFLRVWTLVICKWNLQTTENEYKRNAQFYFNWPFLFKNIENSVKISKKKNNTNIWFNPTFFLHKSCKLFEQSDVIYREDQCQLECILALCSMADCLSMAWKRDWTVSK